MSVIFNSLKSSWQSHRRQVTRVRQKDLDALQRYFSTHSLVQSSFAKLYFDRISLVDETILVEGWTSATNISALVENGVSKVSVRIYEREDLKALSFNAVGFSLAFDRRLEQIFLQLNLSNNQILQVPLHLSLMNSQISKPSRFVGIGMIIRDAFTFGISLSKLPPPAISYLVRKDENAKQTLKKRMKLDYSRPLKTSKDIIENPFVEDSEKKFPFTEREETYLILPVYNAFDHLQDCLVRLLKYTDLPFKILIIEDCSTDAQILRYLEKMVAKYPDKIDLIQNQQNLGFLGSANRGMELAIAHNKNIVLVNTDAMVPKNWLSRLMRPIYEEENVASVTPFSSDATILTIPSIASEPVELRPSAVDAIDKMAQKLRAEKHSHPLPTGVGFCMAMSIKYLKQVGTFDTTFGKGYGEEVDWCQKAHRVGGKNVACTNLFVEHRGGASFGNEQKIKLIQKSSEIISKRYKDFDHNVQVFIAQDPIYVQRFLLSLIYAQSLGTVRIYFAHNMGGGAENYLLDRIRRDAAMNQPVLVVRVGEATPWKLELYLQEVKLEINVAGDNLLQAVLAQLNNYRLFYSNLVGAHNAFFAIELMKQLATKKFCKGGEIFFHDYFPVSPGYDLLNSQGRYEGVPKIDTQDEVNFHRGRPLRDWRETWLGLLNIDKIEKTVFSQSSYEIVSEAYPSIASKLKIQPHLVPNQMRKISTEGFEKNTIGVLGAIGYNKGAAILSELSEIAKEDRDFKIVVIGYVDMKYKLASNVTVHGRYIVDEIPNLVEKYGISKWLMPSICPETFSFTTHEMLATGLPVFGFDLGAQAEILDQAPNGNIVDKNIDAAGLYQILKTETVTLAAQ